MNSLYLSHLKWNKNPYINDYISNKSSLNQKSINSLQKTYDNNFMVYSRKKNKTHVFTGLNSVNTFSNQKDNSKSYINLSKIYNKPNTKKIYKKNKTKDRTLTNCCNCRKKESSYNYNLKISKLNTEIQQLNKDNILLKEDINKFSDLNTYYKNELKIQKEHNKELIEKNNQLIEENNNLNEKLSNDSQKLKKLLENKENIRYTINNIQKNLDTKNLEINNNYEELVLTNKQVNKDYYILQQEYEKLNSQNKDVTKEIKLIKDIQKKNFDLIETKIENIIQEIEKLKNENEILNRENIENKTKFEQTKKDKENYYSKYTEEVDKKDKLMKELYNNKYNLDLIKYKINEDKNNKEKINKRAKSSKNKKKDIIKELQIKIKNYKNRSMKNFYCE